MNKQTLVRHHLLECILWPNGNGTFRTINNSMNRLIELGIYYDYKLCITITNSAHWSLHHSAGSIDYDKVSRNTKEAMKSVDYDKLAYWKGKKQTEEQKSIKIAKMHERRESYLQYKKEGGLLKWNEFQKKYFNNYRQVKDRVKHGTV